MVGKGAVHVAHGGEGGVGDDTGVVGMAGGNSVGKGQTSSHLSDGVGVSIGVSRPLADSVVEATMGEGVVGVVGSVAMSNTVVHVVVDVVQGVGGVGDDAGVVGMAGGNSVGVGKASSNLADGVGVSVRVSRPLADGVVEGERPPC